MSSEPLHAVLELRHLLPGGGLPENIQLLVRQQVEFMLRPAPLLPRRPHLVLYLDDVPLMEGRRLLSVVLLRPTLNGFSPNLQGGQNDRPQPLKMLHHRFAFSRANETVFVLRDTLRLQHLGKVTLNSLNLVAR